MGKRAERKVTIVGGGVAGLEALIALRALAPELTQLELMADTAQFAYKPLAVAEPFGAGVAHRFDLTRIARDHGARLHIAGLAGVDAGERHITTWDGRDFEYDLLLVAIGARAITAVPGSVSIKGPAYTSRFRTILRELDKRKITKVAFAVPAGTSWPLPLYELALLTAAHVAERRLRKVELRLVTDESRPLGLFGSSASEAIRTLLEDGGVELLTDRVPVEAGDGELVTAPGPAVAADRVVSLPRIAGPSVAGLPHDRDGFIPVDGHARITQLDGAYAAGDATTCPIKQGGVATQQADAAAEAIAAELGAGLVPQPFRPVLRGLLLTGGAPRYLRAEVAGGRGEHWPASESALWWPPGKIAGRYLAPYLATELQAIETPRQGIDVEVAVDTTPLATSP